MNALFAVAAPTLVRRQGLIQSLSWRGFAVALGAAVLISTLGASTLRSPAAAATKFRISPSIGAALPTMSTGKHQSLVVAGTNAQERNALIPLSGGSLVRVGGFSAISPDSSQYATALKCMTQAIYYEAANEPIAGKRAVAQVVLNRLKHPAYPNSVCGVVYEGANAPVCQFSFTCDGSLLRTPAARQWAESRSVAQASLAGSVMPDVGSATNYHADYVLPRWAFTLGKITKIGAHIFYRLPGSGGSAAVFGDRWSGIERIPALDMNRLRHALEAEDAELAQVEEVLVPGLTVAPDVKDRHAERDVGGRLDTTRTWRLSIPDPQELSAGYASTLSVQGAADVSIAGNPHPEEAAER
jgi:spore germination cell wall hydrolase CwlJ-like protein